jgi:hypothetical protein
MVSFPKEKHPFTQTYVITLGSMGDGFLPVRCQELSQLQCLTVGLWSQLLKENDIYNDLEEPFMAQLKKFLRKSH